MNYMYNFLRANILMYIAGITEALKCDQLANIKFYLYKNIIICTGYNLMVYT